MIQTPKAKSNQSFSVTSTINSYPATSTATSTGTWNARSTLTSKTNHKINVVYLIVFVVGLIWGLVLWETHYALLTWHPSSSGEIGPQVLSRISLQQETWKDNADLTLVSHIGWQPHIHTENACSWRECFKPEHNCPKCRDLLEDMEQVPDPPSNWVPDVTMLHRMRIQGKDAQGRPWPPPLDAELCQPIGNFGGKQDDNKACESTHVDKKKGKPIYALFSTSCCCCCHRRRRHP